MIRQLFNIPSSTQFVLACSGGVDSMAIWDFYRRGRKDFQPVYFNHGTPQANEMQTLVVEYALDHQAIIYCGTIENDRPKGISPEEHWRNERYSWLHKVAKGRPIITCHHLDDCCETWIFSALHGNPKVIAPIIGNKDSLVFRPFLTTRKQDMIDWCIKHQVSWFEDKSNEDIKTPRNRIRHQIMKEALEVNPGLHKVIKKKVLDLYLTKSCVVKQ